MRHEPTAAELLYLDAMDADEKLHYFITRTMESEEIWRLCNEEDWVISGENDKLYMKLWPYSGLAMACAAQGESADAVSLEYFVYHELNAMHAGGIGVEIFPAREEGIRMSARQLFQIFDHKLDEEQYFIEG